jgi:hypothetical protein
VEKGCAAPVDVAAEGVCEELSGLPCRGAAVDRTIGVVVMARRKGRATGRWIAVRRQRLQIIVCVIVVEDGDLDFEILLMRMRLGQRFDGVDAPRLSESGLCSVALSQHEGFFVSCIPSTWYEHSISI